MQCTYNVTLGRVHATIVVVKAISIAYSDSIFLALVIKNAMRMRHIAIRGMLPKD